MNTQLEKLFAQYYLSQKDQYEIRQIYNLLPIHKQHNLLQNFPILAMKLNKIQEELREEREILVGNKVDKITEIILKNRKNKIKKDIEKLKGEVGS